jgi:hypothetical protein
MFVNYPPLNATPTSAVGSQIDYTDFVLSADTGVSDGVVRIFETQRRGTFLSVRVDNHPPTTGAVPPTDATAPGVDTFIGGHLTGSVFQGLSGAIGEVLAINGTLAPPDDDLIHAYLSAKYGIH